MLHSSCEAASISRKTNKDDEQKRSQGRGLYTSRLSRGGLSRLGIQLRFTLLFVILTLSAKVR